MKQIYFLCCFIIFFSAFSFCQNRQLELQVEVLISEVTPFEPVVLNIKAINNTDKSIKLYRFSPNKSIKIN